jgi:hypothetical protein
MLVLDQTSSNTETKSKYTVNYVTFSEFSNTTKNKTYGIAKGNVTYSFSSKLLHSQLLSVLIHCSSSFIDKYLNLHITHKCDITEDA